MRDALGILELLGQRYPAVVAAMAAEHITLARQEAAASSGCACAGSRGGTAVGTTMDGVSAVCSSSSSAGGCSAALSPLQLVLSPDQSASCRAMSSGQVSLLRVLRMGLELRASNTYQAIRAASGVCAADASAASSAQQSNHGTVGDACRDKARAERMQLSVLVAVALWKHHPRISQPSSARGRSWARWWLVWRRRCRWVDTMQACMWC